MAHACKQSWEADQAGSIEEATIRLLLALRLKVG
jgi:hypothetical protein